MGKVAIVIVALLGALTVSHAFSYGKTQVRGVNLGGWLVLESWITPQLFQGVNAHDEYTFCKTLGYNEAEKRLKAHWDTWVTENDIIALKNAGINHIRIPFGYWAWEWPTGEPWIWGSWDYVMRACGWAKKHGLNVMVDLHAAPGSQNGNDHSGRSGPINFFYSDANLQLATRVIGKVAQTFNTAEWKDTVTIVQLVNEPVLWDDYDYRLSRLKQYYRSGYDEVRKYNKDIVVAVHDAFIGAKTWYYLRDDTHYKNVMIDQHHYQVFNADQKDLTCAQHHAYPCRYIGGLQESNVKLWTVIGEWSLATPNSCGNQGNFAKQQIGVWEKASGWFMWNFKHGNGWNEWDFLASHKKGWIPSFSGTINPTC